MSVKDKKVKDKTELQFNPITGEFDIVVKFNPNRMITHEYNIAGTKNMIYDPASKTHVEMGAQVVVDDDGNVVIVGK